MELFYSFSKFTLSYAMRINHDHTSRFRLRVGVTDWYQSFNCSEPRFFLESSLQSLGSSHENNFYKNKRFFIA
ncbi:hypothetical protein Hanom_Chr04g00330631 [Helianthus anomalus]